MVDSGTTLSDRYRLESPLGSGGAGEVWRATDSLLGREVAVKLLRSDMQDTPEALKRFRSEATAAAGIHHRNAVIVYDIGEDGGRTYLVMELVEGAPLSEAIRRGPLDPDLVAVIGHDIGRALGAAHEREIVHRDVKPGNVLLSQDGLAKITDFGIAKALGPTRTQLTAEGTVVGTAAYLSPEQLRDDDVTPRTDVYALGLVLHHALTGSPPFGEGTPAEVAARRLESSPEPASELRDDVPPELSEIIERAIHIEPRQRFEDGTAMARALESLATARGRRQLSAVAGEGQTASDAETTRAIPPVGGGGVETARDATEVLEPSGGGTTTSTTTTTSSSPTAAEPDTGSGTSTKGRWLQGAVAAAVLGLAVLAVVLLGGSGEEGGGDGGGATPVPVAQVTDLDPPPGDGEEHREDVSKAIDGDPQTVWTTELRYESADFGGLKSGVGLSFDLGEPHDVQTIQMTVPTEGIAFRIYAGDGPPQGSDPSAFGQLVDERDGAGGQMSIEVPDEVGPAQYWTIWITSLVSEGGGYHAAIGEVSFLAG